MMQLIKSLGATLLVLAMLPLAAHAGDGKLTISDGWVRAVPPVSKNTAAYFTIHNGSPKDDTILHLVSDAAEVVELHTIVVESNGAKRMQKMPHATVKAGEELVLKPGGYHLMLIGLKEPLKDGDKVAVEMIFQHAGKQVLRLPVSMGEQETPADQHHHHHHH